MFVVIVLAVVGFPLIGLMRMEAGGFGPDIMAYGSYNGASIAYSVHLAFFFATWAAVRAVMTRRHPMSSNPTDVVVYSRSHFRRLAIVVSLAIAVFTVFLLFGAGGWRVVIGATSKGEYRGSFGLIGPFMYLARDLLIPVSSALVAFVYRRCDPSRRETALVTICLVLTGFSSLVWGFKAGSILTMVPALCMLFPTVRFRYVVTTGLISIGALVISTMMVDRVPPNEALTRLTTRATLGTANSAWKIWQLQALHVRFPDYLPTMNAMVGGRVGTALGLASRHDLARRQAIDFAAMLTNIVKDYAPEVNNNTTSVTGTVFSEGVIALGSRGFVLFSVLAGLVVALNGHLLSVGQALGRPLMASMAAAFVIASTFAWLNAGGLVQLVSLPYALYYLAAYFAGSVLLAYAGIRKTPLSRGSDSVVTLDPASAMMNGGEPPPIRRVAIGIDASSAGT